MCLHSLRQVAHFKVSVMGTGIIQPVARLFRRDARNWDRATTMIGGDNPWSPCYVRLRLSPTANQTQIGNMLRLLGRTRFIRGLHFKRKSLMAAQGTLASGHATRLIRLSYRC